MRAGLAARRHNVRRRAAAPGDVMHQQADFLGRDGGEVMHEHVAVAVKAVCRAEYRRREDVHHIGRLHGVAQSHPLAVLVVLQLVIQQGAVALPGDPGVNDDVRDRHGLRQRDLHPAGERCIVAHPGMVARSLVPVPVFQRAVDDLADVVWVRR